MNSSSPRAPPSAPPTPKRRPTCFVAAKPRASQQKHAHEINRLDLYRDLRNTQPTVSGPRPAPYPVVPPFHCRRSDRSPRTVNRMHFASSMEPMTPRELLSYVLDPAEVTELDRLPDESLRIFAPTPSPAYTSRQWRRRPATASPRRGDPYSLPAYLKRPPGPPLALFESKFVVPPSPMQRPAAVDDAKSLALRQAGRDAFIGGWPLV